MLCETARLAVSANLDDEDTGVAVEALEAHLVTCSPCRGWAVAATDHHRTVRVQPAPAVPDLTAGILAAIGNAADAEDRRRGALQAARWLVVACAALQLMLTVPQLLGASGVPVHLDHELGAWDAALAFGLLYAAWKPERAWGMLPMVAAIVASLAVATVVDIASGRATWAGESAHVSELFGLVFLWQLATTWRRTTPRRFTPAPAA